MNVHKSSGESSQDTDAASVQSLATVAGYLMSLVIDLLWPPRISALLLLMYAGTEKDTARTLSFSPSSLPSLT